MFNLLTFATGLFVIFLLARYNRSNKLFWILLTSMLGGFVGGSIYAQVTSANEKKFEITQSDPMQYSSMSTAFFADGATLREPIVETTKSAGQIYSVSDVITNIDPLTGIYESDVGNKNIIFNTS